MERDDYEFMDYRSYSSPGYGYGDIFKSYINDNFSKDIEELFKSGSKKTGTYNVKKVTYVPHQISIDFSKIFELQTKRFKDLYVDTESLDERVNDFAREFDYYMDDLDDFEAVVFESSEDEEIDIIDEIINDYEDYVRKRLNANKTPVEEPSSSIKVNTKGEVYW